LRGAWEEGQGQEQGTKEGEQVQGLWSAKPEAHGGQLPLDKQRKEKGMGKEGWQEVGPMVEVPGAKRQGR
jgi:hypothetical protein